MKHNPSAVLCERVKKGCVPVCNFAPASHRIHTPLRLIFRDFGEQLSAETTKCKIKVAAAAAAAAAAVLLLLAERLPVDSKSNPTRLSLARFLLIALPPSLV